MTLSVPEKAIYHDCVKFEATIKSFPKHSSVVWIKGQNTIDIKQAKYEGSVCDGEKPVLCIKHVTKEDEGTYKIKVINDKGATTSFEQNFNVIGGKLQFLSFKLFSQLHNNVILKFNFL